MACPCRRTHASAAAMTIKSVPSAPRPPTVPYPMASCRESPRWDDLRCAQRGGWTRPTCTWPPNSRDPSHAAIDGVNAGGANEPNPSAKLSAAMALNSGTASRLAGTAAREPIREPNRLATPEHPHAGKHLTRAGAHKPPLRERAVNTVDRGRADHRQRRRTRVMTPPHDRDRHHAELGRIKPPPAARPM